MTQEALAEKATITSRALSQIEAGRANPTWATVRAIAATLGVSLAELAKLAEKHE
jgi:transcriptional regulator with XRE-family HTH domain